MAEIPCSSLANETVFLYQTQCAGRERYTKLRLPVTLENREIPAT